MDTPDEINLKNDDIYTRVRMAIQANDLDKAVRLIEDAESRSRQIDILYNLARDLARALAPDLYTILDRVLTVTDSFNPELHVASEFVHNLDNTLDLVLILGLIRARADAAHEFSRELDVDLSDAFDRARTLELSRIDALALGIERGALDPKGEFGNLLVILRVLPNLIRDKSLVGAQGTYPTATLTGIDRLTPAILANQVAPYFQAIIDIQAVIADLQGKPFTQPAIRSLFHRNPLDFSLEGVGDAINSIKEDVIPWRRKHARQLAALEEIQREVQIREIETRTKQAEQQLETEEERQLRLQEKRLALEEKSLALEEKRLDLKKKQQEIEQERINLAISMVDKLAPNLSVAQRFAYVMQILEPLRVVAESPLELVPPSTLPEQ